MKLPTLVLLGATGMVATGLAVWTATQSAARSNPAAAATRDPVIGADPALGAVDPLAIAVDPVTSQPHFTAGKTLMIEGRLGHQVLPSDSDSETFLFADITADATAQALTQVPLDLAIVIDRSGSMKGKRLENALAAARSAIGRLRDGDLVSVVTYNTAAEVVVSPTTISPTSRATVLRELKGLKAMGDTCISCGIDAGMRQLGERPNMVARILLLSDGLATRGVRDLPSFQRIAEDCRRMGASITTIGVDVDYDEKIMAALARNSNGRHFFVENAKALPEIFDQEMLALTRTVANRADLVIDLAPGVFAEQVYDRVTTSLGSQVIVPLGAFAAGEHKTMLMRVRVPHGAAGERPIATMRLRYDDLVEGKAGNCEGALTAELSADPSRLTPLDGIVSARVSSSETAEALEQANLLFNSGRADEARQLLRDKEMQLSDRHQKAKMSAPVGRGSDVDNPFEAQATALSGAGGGFEPTAAAPDAEGDEAARPGKAQTRSNAKDAFDLSN